MLAVCADSLLFCFTLKPRATELIRGFEAGLSHSCIWSQDPLESWSFVRKGGAYKA